MSEIITVPFSEALAMVHPEYWGRLPDRETWPVKNEGTVSGEAHSFLRQVMLGQVRLEEGLTYEYGGVLHPTSHGHGTMVAIDNETVVMYGQQTIPSRDSHQSVLPPALVSLSDLNLGLGCSRMIPIPLDDASPSEAWPNVWYVRHHALGIIANGILYRTARWPHERIIQLIQNPSTKTNAQDKPPSVVVGQVGHYTYTGGPEPAQLLWRDNAITFLRRIALPNETS